MTDALPVSGNVDAAETNDNEIHVEIKDGLNATAPDGGSSSVDVLEQYGLSEVLNHLRARKLRTTFAHYLSDIPTDIMPIRPRCKAGSLMEIAMQPVNEDERKLEEFDERILRAALTLREGGPKLSLPTWLDEEQPLVDDDRKRRRDKRKKKKKRRSSKRKREGDGDGTGAGDHEDGLDEDERRLKRKRKKKKSGEETGQESGSVSLVADHI